MGACIAATRTRKLSHVNFLSKQFPLSYLYLLLRQVR